MPIERVLHQGRDCAVALCDDVLVEIWEGPAHLDVMRMILTTFQSLRRGEFQNRKLYVLHIVAETASPPDSEGRKIAARYLDYFDHHVNVTEGTGFRASFIRSALVGITLLSGHRTRHDVTASLSAGLDALAKAGCCAARADLERTVGELRARMGGRPA